MIRAQHLATWLIVLGAGFAAGAWSGSAAAALPTTRGALLDVNRLSFPVWNQGSYAYDLVGFGHGLEFPRGSGDALAYAGGIWFAGQVGGELRTVMAEFGTDFRPGPVVNGGYAIDTLRYRVYKVARGDTSGWATWMARAVPLGAPVDASGNAPANVGDQTLWTSFNDAAPVTELPMRGGRRMSPPVGLEIQLTAYAFNRVGPVRDAAYFHWVVIHQGTVPLDSVYVGLFLDARLGAQLLAACDTSLDLGYSFHVVDDASYGSAAPAVGLQLLRGPQGSTSTDRLRATSFVVYPNGADPSDSLQVYRSLRGFRPWGDSMIDSSSGLPTKFWSSGDPAAGTGWVATNPTHPHWVLASGPFHLAPGDTQVVDAALVVGWGPSHLASTAVLRANATEVRRLFDDQFASLPSTVPPPEPRRPGTPIRNSPNPSIGYTRLTYRVPSGGGAVEIALYDLSGRKLRTLVDRWQPPGLQAVEWDGIDDDGRPLPPGLYFVHGSVGGVRSSGRIVLVR